jgi:glycosyltransferase involved in cell wall biosynthesis
MKIWLINQYNALPEHGHFNRNLHLAKGLLALGHEPVVLSGSSPHNSQVQLIEGKETFINHPEHGFSYLYVKTGVYGHSKKKQVLEMFRFNRNVRKTVKTLSRPDVIVGSSMHPLAALLAIRLARKYKCKSVVEIRDLWPESMVSYGLSRKRSPPVRLMYAFERYLYTKADAVVFTMEGGRDYIAEQRWDKAHGGRIDLDKVYHVNNGVDLADFDRLVREHPAADPDLLDPAVFKVVYTGSIRKVNGIDLIVDAAKTLQDAPVKFLIWGTGSELPALRSRCQAEGINNVVFNGFVAKEAVPGIISKADLLLLNYKTDSSIARYGSSQNKLFEYMAAGKPIVSNARFGYDLIERYGCGLSRDIATSEEYDGVIKSIMDMAPEGYQQLCANARKGAREFDFASLAMQFERALSHQNK